jgi:hypothetical protein
MMKKLNRYYLIITLCFLIAASCNHKDNEAVHIREMVSKNFDQSGKKTTIDTIVVVGNYALCNWKQDSMAGRALVRKQDDQWRIWLCGGKGLKEESGLIQAGLPADTASMLARQFAAAEASLSTDDIQRYDAFGPNVDMSSMNAHHQH